MNLIQELQNDILDPKTNLSSILRRARVLASILRNEEFKKWVDDELNGYKGNNEEIPDYRQVHVESFGDFVNQLGNQWKNVPIPTLNLPDRTKKFATEFLLAEGVRALESHIESDLPCFNAQWPANLVAIISDKIYRESNCISAWKSISRGQVEQVLDTVRNRLLDFVIELQERYPEIGESEDAISKVPKKQVSSVVNTFIFGNNNVVASGSGIDQEVHQQIHKNDLDALLRCIEMIGVPSDDAEELKKAIEEDGPRTGLGKFGSKVADWVGKMTKKTLEGTWKVASSSAQTLITKALFDYYGWELGIENHVA